ncbi:hypothetical protein INQ25_03185 [Wolbachia endosymbiont of Rhagoletis cerasi]|nr:hypothetical protein [Wolbachia endosymbiont (group A) of Platycheirus albimanus]MBS9530396.1 hypothetical protein [Wolbachia endosymbiont of Rhagoletis cerasi]RLT59497.1 hypothetical protein WANA31_0393 [Wolbachia endosymbiont of Drosophila ananassae]RLT61216.1 hypothetical protein WANA34_0174 [Wolbachia endosymbiont of Drosophila ananassae]
MKCWIPVSGHWDDTIGGCLDDKKRSTGMTAIYVIPRFIRGISAANKRSR